MSSRPQIRSQAGRGAIVFGCVLLAIACRGGPASVEPAWLPGHSVELDALVRPFSGERALSDARQLARFTDRTPGSRDSARARKQITDWLHEIGARSEEWSLSQNGPPASRSADTTPKVDESVSLISLVGVLPGRSEDLILLVAHYDGAEVSDGDDPVDALSGAAVVLELGRALAARPRPYTIWLVFVDGDGAARLDADARGAGGRVFEGSALLAESLERRGALERVRLAIFFESLAHPDLQVVRDLRSQRVHREAFWESARALGLEDVFVPSAPFGAPRSAHRALLDHDLRGVVAIVGEKSPGGGAPDGSGETSDDAVVDAQMASRLDELGAVSLDALDRIALRLSRIDGFAVAPLTTEPWENETMESDRGSDGAGVPSPKLGR